MLVPKAQRIHGKEKYNAIVQRKADNQSLLVLLILVSWSLYNLNQKDHWFACLSAKPSDPQGLLLVICLGMTSGGAQGAYACLLIPSTIALAPSAQNIFLIKGS